MFPLIVAWFLDMRRHKVTSISSAESETTYEPTSVNSLPTKSGLYLLPDVYSMLRSTHTLAPFGVLILERMDLYSSMYSHISKVKINHKRKILSLNSWQRLVLCLVLTTRDNRLVLMTWYSPYNSASKYTLVSHKWLYKYSWRTNIPLQKNAWQNFQYHTWNTVSNCG